MDHVLRQGAQLAQGLGDIVEHRQRRVQGALLEQHTPMVAHLLQLVGVGFADVFAEHPHAAARGALEPEHLP